MSIGERIRQLRVQKGLSQGDIERTSGLLRCYISRVEHGHTVPSLETLERFAAGLDLPLYRLFYTGDEESSAAPGAPHKSLQELAEQGGAIGSDAGFLLKLKGYMEKMAQSDRALLLDLAKKLADR
jgi:transcriptional regulator with XRE-family HTH domain